MRVPGLNQMAHALQLVEGVWTIPIIALGTKLLEIFDTPIKIKTNS